MNISRVLIGLGCAALLGVAFAQSIKQISVALADKTLKLNSVVVKGETYVSLKQLKAAFPAVAGGAVQTAGTTGCINQLLFNGAWRFQVQKVFYSLEERTWFITVELRNGMNKTARADWSGSDRNGSNISLILASGKSLKLDNNVGNLVLTDLSPGASVVTSLEFKAETNDDKATKFLWAMSAEFNGDKAPLAKDAAFRIDLGCTK